MRLSPCNLSTYLNKQVPCRPNPIGLSIVRLIRMVGTTLVVEDVDVLDGTPLLDLKPYVPAFDSYPGCLVRVAGACCEWCRIGKVGYAVPLM